MSFTKFDLKTNDYLWTDNSDIYQGLPSRRGFNRNNGNQVLFLINCYSSIRGPLNKSRLLALEDFLVWSLASEAKSEISVLKNILQEFDPVG